MSLAHDAGHMQAILSEAQIAGYERDGYITVPQLLDPEIMTRLTAAIDGFWETSRGLTETDRFYDIGPGHAPERPNLRRVSRPNELEPVFREIAFASPVADVIAELVGRPVKFYHAKVNYKGPSGAASVVQWHQDWPHFPHTNHDLLAASVPIRARTPQNGCLMAIPGSHKGGPLPIWKDGVYVFTCDHALAEDDKARAERLETRIGDVTVHHGLSVHASEQNRTDEVIATLTIQYAAADAFAYTAPVIDSEDMNRMVRGEPATHARVEAGMVELPPDFSAGYKSLFASQDEAAKM